MPEKDNEKSNKKNKKTADQIKGKFIGLDSKIPTSFTMAQDLPKRVQPAVMQPNSILDAVIKQDLLMTKIMAPYNVAALMGAVNKNLGYNGGVFNAQKILEKASQPLGIINARSLFSDNSMFDITQLKLYKTAGLGALLTNNDLTSISDSLCRISGQSFLHVNNVFELQASKSLASLNYANIFGRLNLSVQAKDILTASFVDVSKAYSKISTAVIPSKGPEKGVYKWSAQNYFLQSEVAEILSIEDSITSEEEKLNSKIRLELDEQLLEKLAKVDRRLVPIYKGAYQVLTSGFDDNIRMFATNMREFYSWFLRIIAPENEVLPWLKQRHPTNNEMYDNSKKPTRKAKISFICRKYDNGNITDYVNKSYTSMIDTFNILNGGTHDLEPNFTEMEALLIKTKMEADIYFLLKVNEINSFIN